MNDPYAILEVESTASNGEIKAAYRRLAALFHPDRNPGFQDAANQRLRQASRVTEADSVAMEENVTACSIPMQEVLGAMMSRWRKGVVEIWVDDGPTLTLRTTPREAQAMYAHVEAAVHR